MSGRKHKLSLLSLPPSLRGPACIEKGVLAGCTDSLSLIGLHSVRLEPQGQWRAPRRWYRTVVGVACWRQCDDNARLEENLSYGFMGAHSSYIGHGQGEEHYYNVLRRKWHVHDDSWGCLLNLAASFPNLRQSTQIIRRKPDCVIQGQ